MSSSDLMVRRRVVMLGALLGLLLVPAAWKLVGMQLGSGDALVSEGRDQRVRTVALPSYRGSILDRTGTELAITLPRSRVVADMRILAAEGLDNDVALEQFATRLAPVLEVDVAELAEVLTSAEADAPWVRLVEAAEPEAAREARAMAESAGVEGALSIEDSTARVHPAGDSALRLIGTLTPDGPAENAGVERAFDAVLRGTDGEKLVELGSSGETITGSELLLEPSRPGADVQLTLDLALQHEVERRVAEGMSRTGAATAMAVIGHPRTGDVLAAVSLDRDPDDGSIVASRSPDTLSAAYQAGSVFKVVTVAAAVEAGLVDPATPFEVPRTYVVDDRTFTDHDDHPTEIMTATEILARSSNVGTIQIGLQVGATALHSALEGFGFGSATGVGHPAETDGLLPPPEQWTRPDLAAASIGTYQSASVLQLWSAYNVIANGGLRVPPRLVDSVVEDGRRHQLDAVPPERVISEESAQQVGRMLVQVVDGGTGQVVDLPGYQVAAKTGTSRMLPEEPTGAEDPYLWADGRYHYLAAFAGYLPADRPEVSITVFMLDLDQQHTGGSAAGPIFADLAELSIRELGIAPSGTGARDVGTDRVRAAPAPAAHVAVDGDGAAP